MQVYCNWFEKHLWAVPIHSFTHETSIYWVVNKIDKKVCSYEVYILCAMNSVTKYLGYKRLSPWLELLPESGKHVLLFPILNNVYINTEFIYIALWSVDEQNQYELKRDVKGKEESITYSSSFIYSCIPQDKPLSGIYNKLALCRSAVWIYTSEMTKKTSSEEFKVVPA